MILLLYQLFFPAVGLAVLLRMIFAGRSRMLAEGLNELRERAGRIPPAELRDWDARGAGRRLWFHAASVGEVRAAEVLIRALLERAPGTRIVLTTTTVAGRERARGVPGVLAVLAPMDFLPAVLAFLRGARPDALILIETELWPMTLWAAARRGVRIALANGRMTERAFGRYRLARALFGPLLASIERAAVQTEADAERFRRLGVPGAAIAAAGNMKYDQTPSPQPADGAIAARLGQLGWAGAPFWTAGSTRRGEEETLLEAHAKAAAKLPGLKLVVVPRHPERAAEIADLLHRRGLSWALWSESSPAAAAPDCIVVDRMGLLPGFYAAAKAAFVGGTLVPIGGHNLLEPAFLGCPVFFGPYTASVSEPARALTGGGAGPIRDSDELAAGLLALLRDEARRAACSAAARRAASAFAGAAERTLAHLAPILLEN